tara:strand:- start:2961 stop:3281 length:321 start_codon:yes stop_codon:yes gene_type:complete
MRFNKLLILLFGLFTILNNCSSFGEAAKVLRNEKSNSNDEFLIKKKEPLTQPPDFTKILEPGSLEDKAESDQSSIEKILKRKKSQSSSNQSKSSSTEESILKQINK